MATAADLYLGGWSHGWAPEPRLTVSTWADSHRVLTSVSSAEAGSYRTDRTPYIREIADALSALSPVREVVFMGAAQIGKTEVGYNWLGYIVHQAPAPTLVVYPTVDVAKRISKQRIAPMIAASPALRERIRDSRARDSGNNQLMKEFDGGMVILTGANSGSGLRSMPIRNLFMDELDAWPVELEGEGDPVEIARARQNTFANRKTFLTSTPTVRGASRIERAFLATDQRRYFVPCPHCGHFDWLRWENIRWEEGDPSTAALMCIACGVLIEERYKTWMLAKGEWRATAPSDDATVRGYHLSALYSPLGWRSWAMIAAAFLAAKGDPLKFRAWWNLDKAETWEERGLGANPETLLARREDYFAEGVKADVPDGVGVLVAAVDVQDDRLEVAVKGYGAAEESWLIAYEQLHGDPSRPDLWFELDAWLSKRWRHVSGQLVPLSCVAIDSGGHHTDEVYRFCRARLDRRIFAIRGGSDFGKPLVARPTTTNRYHAKLFTLCVDSGKETVYSRLAILEPGAGFMHFPGWADEEYFAQLTSEKGIWRSEGAVKRREWIKTRARNEALDLEVYALAALHILGAMFIRSLPERVRALSVPLAAPAPDAGDPGERRTPPRRPGGSGWVGRWNRR